MVNLTEILQKELRDGEKTLGAGTCLLFDNFTGNCLLQTDEGIFVADKAIPHWDYVEVAARPWQNGQLNKRSDNKQFLHCIEIGQKIYNQNGAALGEVVDVELTSKFVIQRLLTSCGRYLKRSDIAAVGDAVIAKAKSAKRKVSDELRKERAAEQPSERAEEQTVAEPAPQTFSDAHEKTANNEKKSNVIYFSYGQTELTNSEKARPTRRVTAREKNMRRKYGDFSFLIGKSVDKTMFNFQGEVMIKQHEIITTEVLRQAKIAGKLLELYLHIE